MESLEGRLLFSDSFFFKAISSTQIGVWFDTTHQGSGTPTNTVSTSGSYTVTASSSAGASYSIDESAGQAIPTGGLTINAYAGANNTLLLGATSGNDTITKTASTLKFGSTTVTFSNMSFVYCNPNGGSDTLSVTGGELVLTAGAVGGGLDQRLFSSLSISTGAELYVAPPTNHTDRQFLVAPNAGFTINGKLDMTSNDLVVQGGNIAGVTGNVRTGNNLTTTATGVVTNKGTAPTNIAVIDATHYGPNTGKVFDGLSVFAGDVLVKWTFSGDENLDGVVDGSDYTIFDGRGSTVDWFNGDFNYDATINTTDTNLINSSFTTEGSTTL